MTFAPGNFRTHPAFTNSGEPYFVSSAVDEEVATFEYYCEPGDDEAFRAFLEGPRIEPRVERNGRRLTAYFGQPSNAIALFSGAAIVSLTIAGLALVLVIAGEWQLIGLFILLGLAGTFLVWTVRKTWIGQYVKVVLDEEIIKVYSVRTGAVLGDWRWHDVHVVFRQSEVRGEPAWMILVETRDGISLVVYVELGEESEIRWLAAEIRNRLLERQCEE